VEGRQEAGWIIRLLFCRLIDNSTHPIPGTEGLDSIIALPPLQSVFESKVLKPSQNILATKKMVSLWKDSGEAARNNPDPTMLQASHEAHETMITELFVSQLRAGDFSTRSLELNPREVTNHISLLLFAPPAYTADEYEEIIEHGRMIYKQIGQGEDSRNQEKKTLKHSPRVFMRTKQDFYTTVAAFSALERIAVQHPERTNSLLTDMLLKYGLLYLIRPLESSQWLRKNASCSPAIIKLFLEFQKIFREMAAWATSPHNLAKARESSIQGFITDKTIIHSLHDIELGIKNAVSEAAKAMSGSIPPGWLTPSSVHDYFVTSNSDSAILQSKRKLEDSAINQVSPSSSPNKKGRTSPTGTPKSESANSSSKPALERIQLTPEERASKESKGILTFSGSGKDRVPAIPIPCKLLGQPGEGRFICRDYTFKGRACTIKNCRNLHLNALAQLEPASATQLRAFIEKHSSLTFSNPKDATGQ
jgi:hypothetical protein